MVGWVGENLPANIEEFGIESCSVGGICEEIGVVVRVFYGTFVLFFPHVRNILAKGACMDKSRRR